MLSVVSLSILVSCIHAQVPTINIPPGTCFLVPNGPFSLDSVSAKSSPMTVFRSHFNQAPQVSPNELIFQPPSSIGPTVIGSPFDRLLPVNRVTDNRNTGEPKVITQLKEVTQEKEATKGGSTSGPRNRIFPERPQIPPSVTVAPPTPPSQPLPPASRPASRPAPPPPAPSPTRIPSTVSPFTVRTIYRRPASRININGQQFITDGLRDSDFTSFVPREQLVNSEELEAIAQFEAALEESKRAGLYGLRTRNAKNLSPSSLPKSPGRSRNVADFSEVIPPPPLTRGPHEAIDFTDILSGSPRTIVSAPREKSKSLDDFFNSPPTIEKPKFYQWLEDSSFLMNMQLAPEVNFTVLLPTDDAIDSLPVSFIESIESNGTKRRELLFYHIIPGSISIDELQSEEMIPTLLKKKGIRVARGEASHSVSMAGGKLIRERGDLSLSNGKVRFIEIDRLLLPPRGSLWTLISDLPELSIFRNLIIDTGLKEQLDSSDVSITLFAPNDAAFASVNREAASLLTRDKAVARSFLLNHFSSSLLYVSSIPVGSSETIKNIASQSDLRIERSALNHIKVNDVTVTLADLQATNGVLQVIEQVLLA